MLIALDAANSFNKVKSYKGEDCYYNLLRDYTDQSLWGNSQPSVYQIGDHTPQVIGSPDFEQNSSFSRDKDRYSSPLFIRSCLIAVARHAENKDNVKLVIGLPSSHFNDPDVRKTLETNLVGTHTVTISKGDHKEVKTFDIVKVLPILQPLGTVFDVVMDEDYVIDPQFLGKDVITIDIGWGTTDVATVHIDRKGVITLRNVLYVPISMFNVYKLLWEKMQNSKPELNGKIFNAFKMDEFFRDSNEDVVFEQAGVKVENAGKLYKEALAEISSRIISYIKGNGVSLEQADRVIFTGGGTSAMLSSIKPHVEGVNTIRSTDSQLSNVRGFYAYGKKIDTSSDLQEV